jgi:hypothetical protein
MQTLLLDLTNWDLVVDINGNIAVASNPYALAQDSASILQTYQGEVYYDKSVGVQYSLILGQAPSLPLIKAKMTAAVIDKGTSGVPEVTGAQCFISSLSNRALSGQVQTTDQTGTVAAANFAVTNFQGAVG